MMLPITSQPASHSQYKVLWGVILPQVVDYLGLPPTPSAKRATYDVFKAYLGYDSLSGVSSLVLHRFTYELLATMAVEFGVYIEMPDEPHGAEGMALADLLAYQRERYNSNR